MASASFYKSIYLDLQPDAIQAIKKTYNLDKPERLEEAITILQEWIIKQDHILKKDFDKHYLERLLISSKGSIEKAKKKMDKLCTMKTLLPHFFVISNVKLELPHILDMAWVVPLPKLTDDYYRVIITKIYNKHISDRNFFEYYMFCVTLCEFLNAQDYVKGYIFVDDYQEANVKDIATNGSPMELQQFMTIITKGYSARLKNMNIITQSKLIDIFVKMFKPLLSQKLADRLYVHKTLEELHQVVPKDILPIEYGGKERPLSELWNKWIEELTSPESVNYIKMMNKACTNEKLRITGKFNEEYMGMPGSFRHLNVD